MFWKCPCSAEQVAVVHLHHSLVKSYTYPGALELSDLILVIPSAHPEEKVLGGRFNRVPWCCWASMANQATAHRNLTHARVPEGVSCISCESYPRFGKLLECWLQTLHLYAGSRH